MKRILIIAFIILQHTTWANHKVPHYIHIFAGGTLTGFAQGTVNGTIKEDRLFWNKNKMSIRSGTWLAGAVSEVVLHRKQNAWELAVGFLGVSTGQVVGEMAAALRDTDRCTLDNHIDVLNMHLGIAAACAAYAYLTTKKKHSPIAKEQL